MSGVSGANLLSALGYERKVRMRSSGWFMVAMGVCSIVFGIGRANIVQIGVGIFLFIMGIVNIKIDRK